ncbi:MAG TPA: hypothetical protein VM030_10855 [Acidimicrobiales bacterium]|nr:hypothetical protein [Acidimicrobiales bacterium]
MRRGIKLVVCTIVLAAGLVQSGAGLLPGHPAPASATTAHPRLLFTAAEVPGMKARIAAQPVLTAALQRLKARADAYKTPGNPSYVDPALIFWPRDGELLTPGQQNDTSNFVYDSVVGQNQMMTVLTELGLAHQLTGDTSYGRHAVLLLVALANKGFPHWTMGTLGAGDLLAGYGFAFDWAYDQMTLTERAFIMSKLSAASGWLLNIVFRNDPSNKPRSNHMGVSVGAGLTLLAIDGEAGAPSDVAVNLEQALVRANLYFSNFPGANGDGREEYTYAAYGLKNSLPFAIAAARLGHRDTLAGTNAQKLSRWVARHTLPGEGHRVLPLSDSSATAMTTMMPALLFGVAPTDGVTQWVWQHTVGPQGDDFYGQLRPPVFTVNTDCRTTSNVVTSPGGPVYCPVTRAPEDAYHLLFWRSPGELPAVLPSAVEPASKWYPEQGLVVARTGYDNARSDVVSSFGARRDSDGHYQHDLGSFTMYGHGASWAVDSGYSCVACGGSDDFPWDNDLPIDVQDYYNDDVQDSGLAPGHNVVLVDENRFTQAPAGNQSTTAATIDGFLDAPGFTWSHADLRYVYGNQAPWAGRHHLLTRAVNRPVILAVTDALNRNGGTHKYRFQLHTDATNAVSLLGSGFTATAPNRATLAGRMVSSEGERSILAMPFKQQNYADISPLHTVLFTDSTPRVAYDHLTVLASTPPGAAAATTRALALTGGNGVVVAWNGTNDVVISKHHGAALVTGIEATTDGTFGRLTQGAGETLLVDGTFIGSAGATYVQVTGTAATVAVSGNRIDVKGPAGNSYVVFAPQTISSVTVNGAAVTACRTGNTVSFPC